jgi:hypothetical protein
MKNANAKLILHFSFCILHFAFFILHFFFVSLHMRNLVLIIILCFCAASAHAQVPDGQGNYIVPAVVRDGDTIIFLHLPEVMILSKHIFKSRREEEQFNRLVHNVRRVYPYAKLAGQVYRHYDSILNLETNEYKRSQMMRQAEREIRSQFESELRALTVTQGRILVLLLDRETSHSAFNLVRDLRNAFQAYLWQSVGRMFGYNLRIKYDPHGVHADIESIVRLIEMGHLQPIPIPERQGRSRRSRR